MTAKHSYLESELGILAWGASVQRAHLYKEGIDPSAKKEIKEFRRQVTKFLSSELLPQYKRLVTDAQHYTNLERLIEYASGQGESLLGMQGYKYGVAQKLLNLTLKYHWCLGLAEEPPHCPVDRVVIEKTKLKGRVKWTQIIDRAEYENVIDDVRRLAAEKNVSIALWELTYYTRRA
jgi:hypothetical protein